jgi:hypothetical protein
MEEADCSWDIGVCVRVPCAHVVLLVNIYFGAYLADPASSWIMVGKQTASRTSFIYKTYIIGTTKSPTPISINPQLTTSSADVIGSKSPCLPRSHPEPSPTSPHQHLVDRASPPSRCLHWTPHRRRSQPACLPVHSEARRRLSAAGPEGRNSPRQAVAARSPL